MSSPAVGAQGGSIRRIDLRRSHRALYTASSRDAVLVDVPALSFLMVDGEGDPNTATAYSEAVAALYALAYALKFASKRGPAAADFAVMPLEGLWWADDMSSFTAGDRSAWRWTMMIAQPDVVSQDLLQDVLAEVRKRKPHLAVDRVRLESFCEGKAAQILHVGPYAAEGPTIERLHAFIADQGLGLGGRHHEIYLGDPRRSAPERLKTILRQPVTGRIRTAGRNGSP